MFLNRLRNEANSGAAVEACLEAELLEFKQNTVTLEERVSRYLSSGAILSIVT